MTIRRSIALAAACCAAAVSAHAAEPERSCDNPQTQTEINMCAAEDARQADADLNRQWAITAAKMRTQDKSGYAPKDGRPGYFAALLEAQRAWIKFRDLECRVEGFAMRGGSAEPMVYSGCFADVTRARITQLKLIAEGYGI